MELRLYQFAYAAIGVSNHIRFNNTYHALFYKMFCSVLKSNDVPTLKALITKQKLIARMIEHYEDKKLPTGNYSLL